MIFTFQVKHSRGSIDRLVSGWGKYKHKVYRWHSYLKTRLLKPHILFTAFVSVLGAEFWSDFTSVTQNVIKGYIFQWQPAPSSVVWFHTEAVALDVSCYDKSSIFVWSFEFLVNSQYLIQTKTYLMMGLTLFWLNLVAELLFTLAEAESGP